MASLVALVGGLIAIEVLSRGECERCAVETQLVDEECEHLGGGWLQGYQTYVCPHCSGLIRRDYVTGPGDHGYLA